MSALAGFKLLGASHQTPSTDAIPCVAGVYIILMADAARLIASHGCGTHAPPTTLNGNNQALYVGSTSRCLKTRIEDHLFGDARQSTFRMTLGCLLKEELNLRPVGKLGQTYFHFGEGEAILTEWILNHVSFEFRASSSPIGEEHALIRALSPLLNISGQRCSPLAKSLMARRSEMSSRWVDPITGEIGGNIAGRALRYRSSRPL
jgi:hypothetical protein